MSFVQALRLRIWLPILAGAVLMMGTRYLGEVRWLWSHPLCWDALRIAGALAGMALVTTSAIRSLPR